MSNNSNREPATLNINELDKVIQDYMSKIADVKIKGISSPDEFVKTFREAFDITEHNYLEDNDEGILCYDLMICQNPLDDEKKQMFYTFFSKRDILERKEFLATVYSHYLDNDPETHVDTMLQICYSKKKTANYKNVQNGFYLEFDENGFALKYFIDRCQTNIKGCTDKTSEVTKTIRDFKVTKTIRLDLENKLKAYQHYPKTPDAFHSLLEEKIKNEDLNNIYTVGKYITYTDAFLDVATEEASIVDGENILTPLDIQQNAYRIALINELAVPGIKRIYFIPLAFPDGNQIGHFVLSTNGKKTPNEEKAIIDKFRVLSFVMLFPLSQINLTSNYINKARTESVNAAKAAIMSRNLSHNLGSHVMFYIKQKLESVDKILTNEVLTELVDISSGQTPNYYVKLIEKIRNIIETSLKNNDSSGNKKEILEMPFLVGLGRFLNYLQERQDFIATVATNHIPFCTTINFKDAIYDELKPELRARRHSDDSDTGKKAENLLLDYIAYSEGFTSSKDIQLLFPNDKTKQDEEKYFSGGYKPEDVPASLREFNIALPGGNMGRQAFFSIMENIIRNTAKHDGGKAKGNTLIFRFDKLEATNITAVVGYTLRQKESVVTTKEGYYLREGESDEKHLTSLELNIEDNGIVKNVYEKYQNDLYYLGITVELEGDANEAINNIKKGLRRAYITQDGQMDEECKGMKEIRISAAWLRSYGLDDEIPADEPPAVAIRETDEGYLQYIICLPKPKKVAFVTSKKKENEPIDGEGCQIFGVGKSFKNENEEESWTFDSSKFEIEKKKIADFNLVICSMDDYVHIRPHVGSRVLKIDVDNALLKYNDCINSELRKSFLGNLHMQWLKQEFPEVAAVKLSILDNKVSREIINKLSPEEIFTGTSDDTQLEHYENNIVFNTHYPGQAVVVKKGKNNADLFKRARFVEAVSGGNSTDRLIRHDKRDAEWYSKHMAAGLSQVAVFDERIFSFIMPNRSRDVKKANSIVTQYFKDHNVDIHSDHEEFVYAIANSLKLETHELEKMYENLENQELTENNVKKSLSSLVADYSKTWLYREKGIWGFNILISPKQNNDKYDTAEIIGFTAPPTRGEIGLFDEEYCTNTIASIKRSTDETNKDKTNKDKIEVIFTDSTYKSNFQCKFDFITVHQGLLDKIYGALKIGKDKYLRDLVTKALFDAFSHKAKHEEGDKAVEGEALVIHTEKTTKKYHFLPQFIIHSGRSKPNKKDMPQQLPFIQFSAIDHAIRDCKYTLTELLSSAHYEN